MDYVKFLMLCYKAYRGDIPAALEVAGILKAKVEEAVERVREK